MALYSFYPCQSNGCSLSFVTHEVLNDTQAFVHAVRLLEQHITAAYVAVFYGERSICMVPRDLDAVVAAIKHGDPSPCSGEVEVG